jgi:hypothetical protein
VFRKASHLVLDATERNRAIRDTGAASMVGRLVGIALGASLVIGALASTETVTVSARQSTLAIENGRRVVSAAKRTGEANIAAATSGARTPGASGAVAGTPAPCAPAPASAAVSARGSADRAYTYEAGGRRDPFISLDRASDPNGRARSKLPGLAGLAINEATVKGVVKSEGRLVAMVQAPDNKTYIVRPNDRLLDGAVRAVTPEGVVFVQQVNHPRSLVKQREIRKLLRPMEEGK